MWPRPPALSRYHTTHTHTHGIIVPLTSEANTSLCPLNTSSHTHQGIHRNKLHCSTTQHDVHCTAHAPHSHSCPSTRTAHTHSQIPHTDSMSANQANCYCQQCRRNNTAAESSTQHSNKRANKSRLFKAHSMPAALSSTAHTVHPHTKLQLLQQPAQQFFPQITHQLPVREFTAALKTQPLLTHSSTNHPKATSPHQHYQQPAGSSSCLLGRLLCCRLLSLCAHCTHEPESVDSIYYVALLLQQGLNVL